MKSFENPQPDIKIEDGYENFVPEEFKADPFSYFTEQGKNLTPWKENMKVKEFIWKDENGNDLHVVAKKVSPEKNPEDPFYEYTIMETINQMGFSCPKPVARVESNGQFMIITEKISGVSYSDFENISIELKSKGYSDEDIKKLNQDAKDEMVKLREKFESAGIHKDFHKDHWKTKDMVFNVDIENHKIITVIPTDFEHTKIDK